MPWVRNYWYKPIENKCQSFNFTKIKIFLYFSLCQSYTMVLYLFDLRKCPIHVSGQLISFLGSIFLCCCFLCWSLFILLVLLLP